MLNRSRSLMFSSESKQEMQKTKPTFLPLPSTHPNQQSFHVPPFRLGAWPAYALKPANFQLHLFTPHFNAFNNNFQHRHQWYASLILLHLLLCAEIPYPPTPIYMMNTLQTCTKLLYCSSAGKKHVAFLLILVFTHDFECWSFEDLANSRRSLGLDAGLEVVDRSRRYIQDGIKLAFTTTSRSLLVHLSINVTPDSSDHDDPQDEKAAHYSYTATRFLRLVCRFGDG